VDSHSMAGAGTHPDESHLVEMILSLRIITILLAALALVPAGAHFFSMRSKLGLSGSDYLASQRAYDNWQSFAMVVIALVLSVLLLTIALYRTGRPYVLTGAALLCILGTQAIFWWFTFPTNRATRNWTELPANWEVLRMQWEYSHAAGALLNAVALTLLVFSSTKT
jgi:hypothetical protein